uniref:Uncharacterized protein n=1 Tax=Cantharellus cibarius TaxID=36066 RepID=A0A2U3TMM5_CANCI|nr:hypothetical protein [Cantharellus cibarius]AWA82164.1 hypothetical protein [Cantharellus cibarius]
MFNHLMTNLINIDYLIIAHKIAIFSYLGITSAFVGFVVFYSLYLLSFFLKGSLKSQLNQFILDKYAPYKLLFLLFLIFTVTLIDIIYLEDKEVTVKIKGIEIIGSGISWINSAFGSSAAFVIGAKIAKAAIAKKSLPIPAKILVPIGVGSSSVAAYRGTNLIFDKISNSNQPSTLKVSLDTTEIKTIVESNPIKLFGWDYDRLLKNKIKVEPFGSNLKISPVNPSDEEADKPSSSLEWLNKHVVSSEDTPQNSDTNSPTPIEESSSPTPIEGSSSPTPIEGSSSSHIVNSPLEHKVLDYDFLSDILNYSIFINLVTLWLIFILATIFTSKIILDKNYSFSKWKSNKIGSIIASIIEFNIKFLSANYIFWIYFIIVSIFCSVAIITFWLTALLYMVK